MVSGFIDEIDLEDNFKNLFVCGNLTKYEMPEFFFFIIPKAFNDINIIIKKPINFVCFKH